MSWPRWSFESLMRIAPLVMNSCPEPLKGPPNPSSPNRRISSHLETGTSLFDNGYRLHRHIDGTAANGWNCQTHPEPQDNPALNRADQLFATLFKGPAGSPDSRQPRDVSVIRFGIIDYFILGPLQSSSDILSKHIMDSCAQKEFNFYWRLDGGHRSTKTAAFPHARAGPNSHVRSYSEFSSSDNNRDIFDRSPGSSFLSVSSTISPVSPKIVVDQFVSHACHQLPFN
jgi:hypothetical protein